MRTHLLTLFTFFIVVFPSWSSAQPTLTEANCDLLVGDKFIWNITTTVSPGSAGANQIWNLSAMTFSTSTNATIQAAASTPSAGSYPAANVSLVDGFISDFYKTSATALQEIGNYYNGGSPVNMCITSYTNPLDYLHFPFNFNDTYTDPFSGSSNNSMVNQTRTGSITVTADGHGTLVIPTGTFTNVMRVHAVTNYTDAVFSTTFTTVRTMDEYRWYVGGTHFPIAGIVTYMNPNPAESTHGYYISQYTTGIKENENILSAVKLFPVPASDVLNISLPNGISEKLEMTLYNSIGQKLMDLRQNNVSLSFDINVSDLPEGVYFIRMVSPQNNLSLTKRFTVSK